MQKTCLNSVHHAAGARMIDFGGWEMPVAYAGIIEEHKHTRAAASAFDVSHMGRLELRGGGAEGVLQRACTRNVSKLQPGRCGYSHICNARGGILDDVIVSRFPNHWLVVCNASNRPKIVAHLRSLREGTDSLLVDHTDVTAMIAVQGPLSWDVFKSLPIPISVDHAQIKRYAFVNGSVFGVAWSLFRTGYTGEDGYELVVPEKYGPIVWNWLMERGSKGGPNVRPAGLGARDTLRLEAGMPLYGHELGEDIDPISAGCGWCVDLSKDFEGCQHIRTVATEGPKQKLVGLTLDSRRIARQGAAVTDEAGNAIGVVTSGTLSPTLGQSIAMAYVNAGSAIQESTVQVDFGAQRAAARVVGTVFYKRPG